MTAQHRMTKAYPLACNCKPGWVSTFFLPTRTHPLACNCETGWVFFLPFFQVTERRRRRRAMSARCRRLSPSAPTTTSTTHPLACNCETGWVFIIFFSSQRTPTTTTSHVGSLSLSASVCTHDNVDNPPPRLQSRDGVGFYHLFFQVNERQRRRRAM